MTSDSPGNHEDLAMSLILYDTLVITMNYIHSKAGKYNLVKIVAK